MSSMQRRGPGSLPPAPTPLKMVISVEDWEAKAPLGPRQTRSVNELKPLCEERPLPLKFAPDQRPSRPSTPMGRVRGAALPGSPSSRPTTPVPQTAHPLHPKVPIATPQQFHDWFAAVDRSVAHSQEAHFRVHLATVAAHRETCDALLTTVGEVEADVASMLEEWRSVEQGGRSLKDACERLLEERDRFLLAADAISTRLEYFSELEQAMRMLNHPGESLVLQTDFLNMVERVDVCLEYMKAHRHFREAEIYILRFQQCLTRAMTLIRMYFVGSLKALTADIQKRVTEKDVSSTSQHHLYYSKFTSVSNQLAPLLAEFERRAHAHPDELMALLTECHNAYFAARRSLLIAKITEEVKGLDPVGADLVELTRSGCGYIRQLCTDEYNLYKRFFNSGEDKLYAYLENLCDYLYDDLRPRILHEPRLHVLGEVCTVLQALMVLDVQQAEEEDEASKDIASAVIAALAHHGERQHGIGPLHISHFLRMILQDAQTRLFFKAQTLVQSEIRYYVPKGDDLAYPDKLTGAVAAKADPKEQESIRRLFPLPVVDNSDTWYPTLRKALWVLSQLHEFASPVIFEDIAQEAVSLCRQSLATASETLAAKNPPTSSFDGLLFLIRHLLLLKETVATLEFASQGDAAIEPVASTDTLGNLLRRTSSLFAPAGLLSTLVMPRAVESIADAKTAVDHELKRACEDLITLSANAASEPLRAFIDRCTAHRSSSEKGGGSLASQDFAAPARVAEVHATFREACARELRAVSSKMRLYLADEKAVGVLLAPVQSKVVDDYTAFRDVVRVEYEPNQVPFSEGNELLLAADLWAWLRTCSDVEAAK
ncbi:Sec34-domain-containing protein [Exidia glandulosa HHB12029]|uniref:Conserved oligomeric Golgi complex subunit 3 n=1 Tax=Exidia glandulosa HHB12029 TaxID=1314781 RepID=A0A165II45_EXIGL|nr:Sec34-domain-containing protein [Exidia glandulosa HHB12029]